MITTTGFVILIIALVGVAMFADFMNNQRMYYKQKYEFVLLELESMQMMVDKLPRLDFRGGEAGMGTSFGKDDDDEDDI